MKYVSGKSGRVFVVRLEDGEIIHEVIEQLAKKENIKQAAVTAVGGIDSGSVLVVGPEDGRAEKINPMQHTLHNIYEVTGAGTLFPDDEGTPILHLHLACGRNGETVTGCVRSGVKVWHVLEVIMTEITGCQAERRLDKITGFKLLQPLED
jgi:predicted DNA-binding protein with PD1-like motif